MWLGAIEPSGDLGDLDELADLKEGDLGDELDIVLRLPIVCPLELLSLDRC